MSGQPVTCDNCRIVIRWRPTIVNDKAYCCPGCAAGGPCTCNYDQLAGRQTDCPIALRKAQALTYSSDSGDREEQ